MSKISPLAIRTDDENKEKFSRLAGDKKAGDFLKELMDHFESHSAGGVVEVNEDYLQVKTAMNRVLEIFNGVHSNARLSEENIRSELGRRIESLEAEKASAIEKARASIDEAQELDRKLQASEGMVTAFKTIKDELDTKKVELNDLKTQLGEATTQLKDLPGKNDEIGDLKIRVAKLETENEQLRERMDDYRSFNGFNRESGGVQLDA